MEPEQVPECDGACSGCTCGVPEYLQQNLAILPLKFIGHHSWKCEIWKSFPLANSWEALLRHGLIPRNFHFSWEVRQRDTEA